LHKRVAEIVGHLEPVGTGDLTVGMSRHEAAGFGGCDRSW
jgi:hypothetical protein